MRRQEADGGVHVPQLTKAPELIEFVQADYPPEALDGGVTAEVKLAVTIAADGSVAEASVAQSAGPAFDEAALAAVRKFRFSPAEVDGQPAAVQVEYVYHFELKAPPPPEAPPPPPKATLTGQIIARGSRTRVQGATVRCGDDPEALEVLTDAEGRFSLAAAPGTCAVRVVASGFELYKTDEPLEPGETREVIFHISPKAVGYETVVRGRREKKEVVRRTLERQELQKVPGSFGDPVRVIQNFPGVARAPFISGQLIVRGAAPDQTLTFLDGVDIPILYHLGGGPSVVNGEFLDRIDFYPGGFGARYGRAVGGIIDVATRRGASDTLHGVVKMDLQDSGFFVEGPVAPGVSVAAAARRSYIDALLPIVLPKDPEGGSLLILPVYWDYQVRLDVGRRSTPKDKAELAAAAEAKDLVPPGSGPPSLASRLERTAQEGSSTYSLMAFGSDDIMKVVATGGGRNRDVTVSVHTLFHRLVGNWTYRSGPSTFTLTPYVGYDRADLDFGVVTMNVDQYNLGLRQDLAYELGKYFTLRVGTDLILEALRGEAEIPIIGGTQYVAFPGADAKAEMQRFARDIQTFNGAAYVELDLKLGPATITPGLRASHAFLNGQTRHAFDPRLWLRVEPLEDTAIKASVGLYTQPPNAEDMEPPPFGFPGLEHEKAFQASLGVEQRLTDAISVDVTGYFNRRFENVVSPGRRYVADDGTFVQERFENQGLGRAYGLELMLRHDVTKNFFGWIAYTLNRSEESRVGQTKYFITSWDQTHILTAVGSYRLPYGFEVGARFRYVTGRPTTPLLHPFDIYRVDGNNFSSTRGEFRSTRLGDFHQLDLRLDKSFLFQSWTLTAYLDVQNVYNAQNIEATFTDYRFREEVAVPGIPILPIVGVKGSF